MAFTSEDKEYLQMLMEPIKQDMCQCKEQLVKINGRISKHDEQIQEALIERSKNREHQGEVERDVRTIGIRVAKIEDESLEYQVARKYPKVFIIGAGIFFLSAIILFLSKLGIF